MFLTLDVKYSKKVTGWLFDDFFDDCSVVPNEKKLRRSFSK